jgi:RNA polymerase sigma-70 factor (ECF subfamily)
MPTDDSGLIDESALITAAQAGDRQAFNELVLRYQGIAYNVAYRILGNADAAADATQDALLSAYRAIDRFRGSTLKSWLLRIVTNACYDRLRTRCRSPEISLDAKTDLEWGEWSVAPQESPEAFAERQELGQAIQRGLSTLPPEQRAVIVLADIQDMSYREVAETLRVPIGTIRSRLSRARHKLREALSRMDALPNHYSAQTRAARPIKLALEQLEGQRS